MQRNQKRPQVEESAEASRACPKRHAADELFVQNVRRKRALRTMGPRVFAIASRLTRAISIEAGTKLWLASTPPHGLTPFEAGAKRIPSTFALDPAGVPDFELSEWTTNKLFVATETLALIDLRDSSYARAMDESPFRLLVAEIGNPEPEGGTLYEPFDFRFFADCVRGHGIRGVIWELKHAPFVTIFSPCSTNLRKLVDAKSAVDQLRDPESKFHCADPELYAAMGMMRHVPNPHRITSDPVARRWNCLDKDLKALRVATSDELETLYEAGLRILEKMRREHDAIFVGGPLPPSVPAETERADGIAGTERETDGHALGQREEDDQQNEESFIDPTDVAPE